MNTIITNEVDVVKEAKKLITKPGVEEIAVSEKQLISLIKHEREIRMIINNQFPVEEVSVSKLKEELNLTQHKIKQLENFIYLSQSFKHLSMEVLNWRDKYGLPSLIPFKISEPVIKFCCFYDEGLETTLNLDNCFKKYYTDIFDYLKRDIKKFCKLASWADKRIEQSLFCEFDQGILPEETKNKIDRVIKNGFFKKENIYIVTEPIWIFKQPETADIIKLVWGGFKRRILTGKDNLIQISTQMIQKYKKTPNPDPVVIGFDGYNFWEIDSFDTTPLEELFLLYKDEQKS